MKVCETCGTSDRNKRGDCKRCANIRVARWRSENPEKAKASTARWRSNNREQSIKMCAEWRLRFPERQRAATKRWEANHPEQRKYYMKAYLKKWQADNSERRKEASRQWWKSHPEVRRINESKRRAMKRGNGGSLSKELVEKVFILQMGKCPWCRQPLGDNYALDHRMPLALGGANEDRNMQLLRSKCNLQKHAKHPIDFMQSRGFLL